MNLSKFTDYSFRSLLYLAQNDEKLCTVEELSSVLELSENHIKKIIHSLVKGGYVQSIKGRNGGIKLGKEPSNINMGEVLTYCEDFSKVLQCNKNKENCTFNSEKCMIKNITQRAIENFIKEFEKYTLQDVIAYE